MTSKIELLYFLIFFSMGNVLGQDRNYYYEYNFEKFANLKLDGYNKVLQIFYRGLKYPAKCREEQIEEEIEILIFHDGSGTCELFFNSESKHLKKSIDKIIGSYFQNMFIESKEKSFTRLTVKYDLDPFEISEGRKDLIIINAYPIKLADHIRY